MFGGKLGLPELLVLMVLTVILSVPWIVLAIPAWWRIFTKAGHPGALSLTMLIPMVNLGVLLWFAFSRWPIEEQAQKGFPPPLSPGSN
jgi:hypothetical protein